MPKKAHMHTPESLRSSLPGNVPAVRAVSFCLALVVRGEGVTSTRGNSARIEEIHSRVLSGSGAENDL